MASVTLSNADGPGPESALTPHRKTTVAYDVAEYVVQEDAWGGVRTGNEVARIPASTQGNDSTYSQNMHFWGCGCWTLRPVQFDTAHLEKDYPSLIYDVVIGS